MRPGGSACEFSCGWGWCLSLASSSILDQMPPDSQTLRLDETVDPMGDDDPFTAKLSFEVRPPP